ncbi:hypothetical protein [Streptomyces virginiae]|uniref:Uncharacterized protein n=1 Tax=Streptomyces virginiae TaxID=1961 RepID=A0ABZ1TIY4_STRVG|nr:hypothetical protein [Streptomyces virginiae]
MNGTITAVARLRAWAGHSVGAVRPGRLAHGLALMLLAALLVPVFMMATSSPASADDKKEPDNYSLYQLASNASSYFSEKNSPQNDKGMHENWKPVTSSPASGGSILGYADPEFSLGDIVGWFFAEVSGSSQTVTYETLAAKDGKGNAKYSGMLDYAHFGAANNDLGLDTMSSGIGGQIVSVIGGSIIWVLYALALAVGTLFYVIIQFLKLINPFVWFYSAVAAVNPTFAEGMTGGDTGGGPLLGLQHWVSGWYGLLVDISWQALVPIFIGVLLIGLVMFKKMDRGSAIKKLIVRVVFIGVGLPLVGSMYSSVLGKFDDSVLGQHAGPTRVVLSTYVDFEAWMMNDRLGIPEEATVSWNDDQASPDAMMAVRTSALAINKQSHGATFNGINIGTKAKDAESAWKDGTVSVTGGRASDDFKAVFSTFGIIGKYIASNEIAASDFESGIKTSITQLDESSDTKKLWFVEKKSYGDVKEFGEENGPKPVDHPVISTDGTGLTSSSPGKDSTVFTTRGTKGGCGFAVGKTPSSCNLSPLAAYNYLNTGFNPSSLAMYSSNNATSGFTRENHMAVSQVGTGPAKFMYWSNSATVLGSIVLLGFWYAIGMLAGAIKRTFGLVAAVPFATLGAMQAIAKVIVYSTAMILEVLVTLFVYQFVSEFLISVPDILAGPVSSFMSPGGLWGSPALGGIIVVVLTLISSLMIMGITFALLRVRKTVLQAMDEVVTKLVDKFLETNSTPKPDKGGLMPALASGAGAGAGMAMGNKLANGFDSKTSGPASPNTGKPTGKPTGKTASTNAGGTNGDAMELTSGKQQLALEGGGQDGPDGPDSPALDGGPGGSGSGGGSDGVKALPGGIGPAGALGTPGRDGHTDKGPLQLTSGRAGSSHSDKQTAQGLSNQGGLSNLGYSADKVIRGEVLSSSTEPSSSRGDAQGQSGAGGAGSVPTSGNGKAVAGQTGPTQFGTGSQGAQNQQGGNPQAAPQHFSGDAVPAPGPAPTHPDAPSTRRTRAAQDTPPPAQAQTSIGPLAQQEQAVAQANGDRPLSVINARGDGASAPRQPGASAPAVGQNPAAPEAPAPARAPGTRKPGSIPASTSTPGAPTPPRTPTTRKPGSIPASTSTPGAPTPPRTPTTRKPGSIPTSTSTPGAPTPPRTPTTRKPGSIPTSTSTPGAPTPTPARTHAAHQPGSIPASPPRPTPAPSAQAPRPPAPAPAPATAPAPRQAPVPPPPRVADPTPQSVETPKPRQRQRREGD